MADETVEPAARPGVTRASGGPTPRAERMAGRVERAARDTGVPSAGVDALLEAHAAAMVARSSGPHRLDSDRHPDFLHPGRTVLILLEDLEELDPAVLAAGALTESRSPDLGVHDSEGCRVLGRFVGVGGAASGSRVVDPFEGWRGRPIPIWRPSHDGAAPAPETDAVLLERVVTAPGAVQRIVLADALDVVRHAHLRSSRLERLRAVDLVERVLLPVASRVHPVLERRFGWWMRRVGGALRSG